MPSEVQERTEAFEALCALGACLAAHIDGDIDGVTTAMRDLLDRVHVGGEEAARHRLGWLAIALASMTGETMIRQYGPGGGIFAIYNNAREIHFDELPEPDQVAVTAVVASMNGDSEGAGNLVREYASAARCAQVAEMLATLISLHTAASRCERPPGAHSRPKQ
jgi:hypothetical protein